MSLKTFARQSISANTFQHMSFYWWLLSEFAPRTLAAPLRPQPPRVVAQSGVKSSAKPNLLVERLLAINVSAPTTMCRVMTQYGSDKGKRWHNYTTVYSALFSSLRAQALRIFEIGLGTNNPHVPFGMGVYGRPGASLRGWRDLFPQAQVFGADIDRAILFTEERIQTFYCDQLDATAIANLWQQPSLQGGVNILLDDGLHTFEGNDSFLQGSLRQVLPGGFYIVEDIHHSAFPQWQQRLASDYPRLFPEFDFALIQLPNATNQDDNNLLVAQRSR